MSHIDFEEIPLEPVGPEVDFTSIYLSAGAIFFFVMFIKSLKY
tara:strand:+ start:359 stop:487 length:129 start_codon:yes stop_codon:yes gene_type:complete